MVKRVYKHIRVDHNMHIRVYPIFAHILGIAARFRPKMPEDAILKRGAPRPQAKRAMLVFLHGRGLC